MNVDPDHGIADATRRGFLRTAALSSGALVLALHLPGCSKTPPSQTSAAAGPLAPNAWLRIDADDTITFQCDRSEMGQGVYTALTMLLAEELGADLDRIRIEFAPPGEAYVNKLMGGQITGASTSVRDAWPKLRLAGAQAREMLIAAAAAHWKLAPADCRVEAGSVVGPDGSRLTFGALARRGGEAAGARGGHAQGAGGFPHHRHTAAATGYTDEGRRVGRVRHRRAPARNVVRGARAAARAQGRAQEFRRRQGEGHARCAGGRADLVGRGRDRRHLVAGAPGARRTRDRMGRGSECRARRRCHPRGAARGVPAVRHGGTQGRRH